MHKTVCCLLLPSNKAWDAGVRFFHSDVKHDSVEWNFCQEPSALYPTLFLSGSVQWPGRHLCDSICPVQYRYRNVYKTSKPTLLTFLPTVQITKHIPVSSMKKCVPCVKNNPCGLCLHDVYETRHQEGRHAGYRKPSRWNEGLIDCVLSELSINLTGKLWFY